MMASAIERLEASKNRNAYVGSTVGFNVLKDDFKLNFISYFTIVDTITYMIINGYDIKLFWGDLLRVCFCLVTWSFGYQGSARIIVFASKDKILRDLYHQVYDFMFKMERQRATNFIVRKFAGYIDVQSKGITILYYSCGILTVVYPVFVYILTKEVILPFGFVIPGVSDVDQPGFALNYCHHILQVVLTVGGLVSVQCINIMFLIGACLMIEVLMIKLKNLGKEVLAKEDAHDVYGDVDMTEIVQLHQDILKYETIVCVLFNG